MPQHTTANQLTRQNSRRLEDWLLANKARLESELQPSLPTLAETISKALGFPVTPANIRFAAQTMDVTIRFASTHTSPLSTFMTEVVSLRASNAALLARVARIEKKLGLPAALPEAAGQPASIH